jgi:hypothetical protein
MISVVWRALPKLFPRVATLSAGHASDVGMKGSVLRLRALVLLAVVCLSALPAQASPLVFTFHERPAGCHSHEHKAHTRQPANYSCCMAGHDAVILSASFLLQPCVQLVLGVLSAEPAGETTLGRWAEHIQISSGGPPGIHPRRI